MKILFNFFILFILIPTSCLFAQWEQIGPFNRPVTALFAPNDTVFAWSGNTVFKSFDNGTSWIKSPSGIPLVAPSKTILADSIYFCLIEGDLYTYSILSGYWNTVIKPNLFPIIDFYCQDKGGVKLLYTTDGSNVFYTGNRGSNWSKINTEGLGKSNIESLAIQGEKLFVCSNGKLQNTSNEGYTWIRDTLSLNDFFYGAKFKEYNDTLLIYNNSSMYYNTKNNKEWVNVSSPGLEGFQEVFISKGTLYARNWTGFYHSTNLGLFWNLILSPEDFTNVFEVTDKFIFMKKKNNKFYRIDKFLGTEELITNDLKGTDFITSLYKYRNSLFVSSISNYVSLDNGTTFIEDTLGLNDNTWGLQHFIFEDTIYLNTYTNIFKRSFDNLDWYSFQTGLSLGKEGIGNLFSIRDTLYLGCSTGIYTTYHGSPWKKDTAWKEGNPIIVNDKGISFSYFLTDIFMTPANSRKWQKVSTDFSANTINGLFPIDNKLFAGTDEGIFYSNDNGTTWQMSDVDLYGFPIDGIISIKNDLYAAGGNKIFRSSDKGLQWDDISQNFPQYGVIRYLTGDSLYLFVGTDALGAWRLPVAIFYPPVLSVLSIDKITASKANIVGVISSFGYSTTVSLEYSKFEDFKNSQIVKAIDTAITQDNFDITIVLSGLNANTTYYCRFKGTNSAGVIGYSSSKKITTAQFLKIDLLASESLLPKQALVEVNTENISEHTAPIAGIVLNQNLPGTEVKFMYKSIGADTWKDSSLVANGNIFSLKLPIEYFDQVGLEYYFQIVPPSGFSSGLKEDSVTSIVRVAKVFPSGINLPYLLKNGIDQQSYNLISFPLDLDNKSSGSIVYPAFKIDKPDNSKYRFLTYVGSNGNYKGIWQENPENVLPGISYWYASREPTSVVNSGRGKTVANFPAFDGNFFTISLKPGYNQIGNPYLKNVNWSDVLSSSKRDEIGSLIGWDRQGDTLALKRLDVLKQFSGGYVYNSSTNPVDLKIPVRQDNGNLRYGDEKEHSLLINLQLNQNNKTNDLAQLGTHPGASLDIDNFDIPAINLPVEFPSLTFAGHVPLMVDIVSENEEGHTWEFTTKGIGNSIARMNWSIEENKYNESLFLHDLDRENLINMVTESSYNFGENTRFRIYSGTERYIKSNALPEYATLMVFPIPAQENATIAFSIPAKDLCEQYSVELVSSDETGKISQVIKEVKFKPGFYEVNLSKTGVDSGIQLIELTLYDCQGKQQKLKTKAIFR